MEWMMRFRTRTLQLNTVLVDMSRTREMMSQLQGGLVHNAEIVRGNVWLSRRPASNQTAYYLLMTSPSAPLIWSHDHHLQIDFQH